MNASMDPAVLQMVQQHVNKLTADVDKLVFEVDYDRKTVKNALQDVTADVKELEKRVSVVERCMSSLQDEQIGAEERIKCLESEQESVKQRVTQVEEQRKSSVPEISFGKFDLVVIVIYRFFFFALNYYLNEYSYPILFPFFMWLNLM